MTALDRQHFENNPLDQIEALQKRLDTLERAILGHYRGISTVDFTTSTLASPGDYGFQTTDNEIQINCNGTVRAISTAAL